MPRTAREKSSSGVYHVMIRGVNKQTIFECDKDYEHFVKILRNQMISEKPNCVIYAYCLMNNHVHLLIKELGESIGDVMKSITSSYVFYFNHKNNRIGHLFQERFKSQTVNDWAYFLTLIRYIHQNPLKAHLVENLNNYRWSSWLEYIGVQSNKFCATQTVLERINLNDLSMLIGQPLTEEEGLDLIDIEDIPVNDYISDEEAWRILSEICGVNTLSDFQSIPRPQQKRYLQEAHLKGIGIRTLSRLTGVPYPTVRRAVSTDCGQKKQETDMFCEDSPEEELWNTYCDEDDFKKYPEW